MRLTSGYSCKSPESCTFPLGHTVLFQRNLSWHAVPVPLRRRMEPLDAPHRSWHASMALLLSVGGGHTLVRPAHHSQRKQIRKETVHEAPPGPVSQVPCSGLGWLHHRIRCHPSPRCFFQLAEHHQLPGLFGAAAEQENVAGKMVLEERGAKASGRQGWKGGCLARCGFGS